jgi:putative Mg2+ transporter-C (MgtC) family protein
LLFDPFFVLDIGVAMLVGTVIGLERQITHHPAGLRTNALVSLGAGLFVALQSQYLKSYPNLSIPLAAQVVTGVGFLGAGLIMKEGLNVKGMNTAATLWCSAALGCLSGAGYWIEALIGCGAVLTLNSGYRPIVHILERRTALSLTVPSTYQAVVTCKRSQEANIRAVILRHVGSEANAALRGLSVRDTSEPQKVTIQADIYTPTRNDAFIENLTMRLGIVEGVMAVSWQRDV